MTGRPTLGDRLRPGYCHRWAANPDLAGSECIDAHAARVAKIILYVWPDASARLLAAALDHDDGEMGLGDVAGPAKRANPDLARALDRAEAENRARLGLRPPELTAIEGLRLHLADTLAGVMHVRERRPDLLVRADWQADVRALAGQIDEAERMYPGGFAALRAALASVPGWPPKPGHGPFAKDAARCVAAKAARALDDVWIDGTEAASRDRGAVFDGAALARAEANEGLADD